MKMIDFYKKKKSLHCKMVKAITEVMEEAGVSSIDISTGCDKAYIISEMFDRPEEIVIDKVFFGEGNILLATSSNEGYENREINLTWLGGVMLCEIDSVYESVIQVLGNDR